MPTRPLSSVVRQLRTAALGHDAAGPTDGQLLECYLVQRDEAAFEALVRRHGPMVLGVCRRVLRCPHDAEDAFQATFLVLVRKAGSIVPRDMVANWLYGVAYQTAAKARALAAKRRARERQVAVMPEPETTQPVVGWEDLRPVLDQELERLPDRYRVAIVLVDLEGKSRKDAARQLGWPEGTLSARLTRGRRILAERLSRRGAALSGGMLATVLAQHLPTGVPKAVVVSTVEAASQFAAGHAAVGVVSARVATLTDGVLNAMMLAKVKSVVAVLLTLGLLLYGVGVALTPSTAAEPPAAKIVLPAKIGQVEKPRNVAQKDEKDANQKDDKDANQKDDGQKNQNDDGQKNQNDDGEKNQGNQGVVKVVDPARNRVVVQFAREGKLVDQVLPLPKNFPVEFAGKVGNINDLKPGMQVGLNMAKDRQAIVGLKEVPKKLAPVKANQNGNGQNGDGQNGDGQHGNGQHGNGKN